MLQTLLLVDWCDIETLVIMFSTRLEEIPVFKGLLKVNRETTDSERFHDTVEGISRNNKIVPVDGHTAYIINILRNRARKSPEYESF
jgi:hypothetical protein